MKEYIKDTKEIQKAYDKYWDQVKDFHISNGWISIYEKDWGDLKPAPSKMDLQHQGMMWRMNSLRHLPDLNETLKLVYGLRANF